MELISHLLGVVKPKEKQSETRCTLFQYVYDNGYPIVIVIIPHIFYQRFIISISNGNQPFRRDISFIMKIPCDFFSTIQGKFPAGIVFF